MAGITFSSNDYSAFPWMQFAIQEYGQKEVAGAKNNARIVLYHSVAGGAKDDETAWCSAFANWCMVQAGFQGTGRANARSWLDWGAMCLAKPVFGAVTVFSRPPKAWQGHVAFYVGENQARILVLGGNQGNRVCVGSYPRSRLLGYRWPAGLPVADGMTADSMFASLPTIKHDYLAVK